MSKEVDDQEVTVEVVPQTVTEIVYLEDPVFETQNLQAINLIESYEIRNIDNDETNGCFQSTSSQVDVSLSVQEVIDKVVNKTKTDVEDYNSGIGEFICTLCNFKCRSLSSLHSHRLIHDKQFVKCHYNCIACGQQFDKAQSLSHHFRTAHSKYSCGMCNYKCEEEWDLAEHFKVHNDRKYSCNECDLTFKTAKALINHQKIHNNTFLYACNKCHASFATTSEVSAHLRTAHVRSKTKPGQIKEQVKVRPTKKGRRRMPCRVYL
ncbi:zinc finger protein 22-like [Onthophagus taurus]|uniref:zinc finger protein 22-like n=1 Tax=Onthophagus taurus TaxID=166361 RepID=UPI000C201B32|nr:zinc finger protein 483-like [Onthophagus taurus]